MQNIPNTAKTHFNKPEAARSKHPHPLTSGQNLKFLGSFHLRIKSQTLSSENKQILLTCFKYIICQSWKSLVINYRINLFHTWPFSTHSVFLTSKAYLFKEFHSMLPVFQRSSPSRGAPKNWFPNRFLNWGNHPCSKSNLPVSGSVHSDFTWM